MKRDAGVIAGLAMLGALLLLAWQVSPRAGEFWGLVAVVSVLVLVVALVAWTGSKVGSWTRKRTATGNVQESALQRRARRLGSIALLLGLAPLTAAGVASAVVPRIYWPWYHGLGPSAGAFYADGLLACALTAIAGALLLYWTDERKQPTRFGPSVWRLALSGALAYAAATAAAAMAILVMVPGTEAVAPAIVLVPLCVLPSIALYLVLEDAKPSHRWKDVGYAVPVLAICGYLAVWAALPYNGPWPLREIILIAAVTYASAAAAGYLTLRWRADLGQSSRKWTDKPIT